MARIDSYAIDGSVDNMDKLLGSTGDGTTANFTADVIANYFSRNAFAESAKHGQTYDYGGTLKGTESPDDTGGKVYIWTEDEDSPAQDYSAISGLVFSHLNNADIDTAPILNLYTGEVVKVSGTSVDEAKGYGLYNVVEAVEYDNTHTRLVLSFIDGVGGDIIQPADSAVSISIAAAGDINLDGLIDRVEVIPNSDSNGYELTIYSVGGPNKTASWLDVSHTILSGSDVPVVTLGQNGDYYIQKVGEQHNIYGPKTSAGWGNATDLNGDPVDDVTYTGGANPGEVTQVTFQVMGANIGTVPVQPGQDGSDGSNGLNGISVVDLNIDGDGNLQVTLSDGSVVDAGPLPGQVEVNGTKVAMPNFIDVAAVSYTSDVNGNITISIADATTSQAGLLTSTDKTKLDSIAEGAEVNVQSDWDTTDTTDKTYIENKPTNLTTFSNTESGSVAQWAEGGDTSTIPSSKLDITAFETHIFNGTFAQLLADTTNTYRLGDIWITNTEEYFYIGTDNTQGPKVAGDFREIAANVVNLGTTQNATTVVVTNTAGDNATINEASTTESGILTPARLAEIVANNAKISLSFGSADGQVATFAQAGSTETIPGARISAADSSNQGAMSAADFTKLTGVAEGAEVNVQSDWVATQGDSFILNKPLTISAQQATDITASKTITDFITVTKDINLDNVVDVEANPTEGGTEALTKLKVDDTTYFVSEGVAVSINGTEVDDVDLLTNQSAPVTLASDSDNKVSIDYSTAIPGTDGLMSGAQALKLNGIDTSADVNVQSDFAISDTNSDAFILNKPVDATDTVAGLMSIADKVKLDGIETQATRSEVNDGQTPTETATSITVSGTTYSLEGQGTNVVANPEGTPTEDISSIQIGSTDYNIVTTEDYSKLEVNGVFVDNPDLTDNGPVTFNESSGTVTVAVADASTSSAGLLTAADKTKLDGLTPGGDANVQSDWDQSDDTADSYIQNKPTTITIPQAESITQNSAKLSNIATDGKAIAGISAEEGAISLTNLTGLKFEGDGLTLTDNGDGTATLRIVGGGGGGTDVISNLSLSITVPNDPAFLNVEQQVTVVANWTKGSGVTLTASSLTSTKSGLDSITIPASADNTFTDSTSWTSEFVAGTDDNTRTETSITLTLNGTVDGNAITPVTLTMGYAPSQILPVASATPVSAVSGFVVTDDLAIADGGNIEAWDSGSATVDVAPANTGWGAGTVGASFPAGITLNGSTMNFADSYTGTNTAGVSTGYTQSDIPAGYTAITHNLITMPQRTYTSIKSLRFGSVDAVGGNQPVFTDDTTANTGLRNLSSFTSGTKGIQFETIDPTETEGFTLTSVSGQYWYIVYDAAEADLTHYLDNGFQVPISDTFDLQTIGGYKIYVSTDAKPAANINITGLK